MLSKNHLEKNNMSYCTHFAFSLNNSFIFMKGSFKGITHTIFPSLYPNFTKETKEELDKLWCNNNHEKN